MASVPFLRTKLYQPRLNDDVIDRPQLIERLDRGLNRKLILISAPAGYGKTTLVSQWLHQTAGGQGSRGAEEKFPLAPLPPRSPARVAWLSLDQKDNELVSFVRYFCAAIQTVFPACCAETLSVLQINPSPRGDELATTLAGEMADLPEKFFLVLDDYHFIGQAAIHQFLVTLIEYLPPSMCLVITSRSDPPLGLARHRARQTMLEIRSNDLRFSVDEVQAYLGRNLKARPAPEVVALLAERTEGWITGLHLAVLALRDQADPGSFLKAFQGTYRYVMEYLLDEILSQQPPAVQAFLLQTSFLNQFCAPLAEALLSGGAEAQGRRGEFPASPLPLRSPAGRSALGSPLPVSPPASSQEILAYLEQADLFIIPLDYQPSWYRYHHLLQVLLVHKLKAERSKPEIAALQARAGDWLADNDLIEEALPYLLASGDRLRAAQLVENSHHLALNQSDWPMLERWLTLLPADLIRQRPGLLLARAWILQFQFNLQSIPPLLQAAEALLADQAALSPAAAQLLRAELDYMWGMIWYWRNEGQRSFDHLQRALRQVPPENIWLQSQARIFFCLAAHMTGQRELAWQAATEALQAGVTLPEMVVIQLLGAQIFVHLLSGELTECVPLAQQALSIAAQNNYLNQQGWGHYLLGYIHYARNELAAAAASLAQAVERRYHLHVRGALDSLASLTLTYQALQQPDQATETLSWLFEFALQSQNPAHIALAHSVQARLWLAQGDLESASRWLLTTNLTAATGSYFVWLEQLPFTACRVLLAQDTAASLEQAAARLQDCLQVAEQTHNTRQMIELLPLQAVAYQKQGQPEAALAALGRAIPLARPGGIIRPFVEAGPPMVELLPALAERGVAPTFIGQILAAFPDFGLPTSYPLGILDLGLELADESKIQNLVEPLTDRELEVLALLAQHRTNSEIARALHISIPTVKSHTRHIYQKLNAKNRYQAGAKAITLRLI